MSNCVYRGHKHSCSCMWGCCTCNGRSCITEDERREAEAADAAQARDAFMDALDDEAAGGAS